MTDGAFSGSGRLPNMQAVMAVLRAHGDVATWEQLTRLVHPHAVTHAVSAGRIIRVLPRVYTTPAARASESIRLRAALLFGGPGSALSHTTAIRQWPRLHVPLEHRVHLLTPRDRNHRSTSFVIVHRYNVRSLSRHLLTTRHGLDVVVPAVALLDAWSVLPTRQRRAPVIDAVRIGLVHPDQLEEAIRSKRNLPGRAELRHLIRLLRAGCQSELELLGFTRVFADPRLPPARRQFRVIVGNNGYALDTAWPELLLDVELDGAAYHSSSEARERDVRRDANLARAGWLTIRVTYDRLVHDPDGVIVELLDIIGIRRAQLGRAA